MKQLTGPDAGSDAHSDIEYHARDLAAEPGLGRAAGRAGQSAGNKVAASWLPCRLTSPTSFNITVMGYRGALHFGLIALP
jgi:hypothetical protein